MEIPGKNHPYAHNKKIICIFIDCERCHGPISTYLSTFTLNADQITPFLNGLCQVDGTQRHLHLADLVVFREAVKVKYGEYERLIHGISIG